MGCDGHMPASTRTFRNRENSWASFGENLQHARPGEVVFFRQHSVCRGWDFFLVAAFFLGFSHAFSQLELEPV